ARLGRLLELEIPGVVEHLLLEPLDLLRERLLAHGADLQRFARRLALGARLTRIEDAVDHLAHRLVDAARNDAIVEIEGRLPPPAPARLPEGALHGIGDPVGVQDRPPLQVARGAPDGLDEAALRAQEAFL